MSAPTPPQPGASAESLRFPVESAAPSAPLHSPAEHSANPLPYPDDRQSMRSTFEYPVGRIWLRVVARLMEWLTDLLPKELNYSEVTPQLSVGGSFRNNQVKQLKARGITAVVDCREEDRDDAAALAAAGMQFLHLPTPDRYAFSFDHLHAGVDWVLDHIGGGGRVFMHCEHGVGRGPLMCSAVLVAQGYTAPEALRIVRAGRWQAMPNDRQLKALLQFEHDWRRRRPEQG